MYEYVKGQNYTSINQSGKKLMTFFSTDILKKLAPLHINTPKQKYVELEGVLDWLEMAVCNLLRNITPGHADFWLRQGTGLLISFLQSPHEQETDYFP